MRRDLSAFFPVIILGLAFNFWLVLMPISVLLSRFFLEPLWTPQAQASIKPPPEPSWSMETCDFMAENDAAVEQPVAFEPPMYRPALTLTPPPASIYIESVADHGE